MAGLPALAAGHRHCRCPGPPQLFQRHDCHRPHLVALYTRLVRAQTVSLRERFFIEAARGMGVSRTTIIFRHILPNVLTPVMVQGTMDIGSAILTGAAMSFIGLGAQPPTPDWGQMVSNGRIYIMHQPWYGAFPGLAIFLVTLAFNLLGDTIRDVADPRSRRAA